MPYKCDYFTNWSQRWRWRAFGRAVCWVDALLYNFSPTWFIKPSALPQVTKLPYCYINKASYFLGTLEPTTRFTINYEKNQYRFVVDKRVTQSQAQKICQDELGHQATILEINSEEELSFINGALNSMKNMKDEGFWVSGMVHADLPFTKWAACHPGEWKRFNPLTAGAAYILIYIFY